MAAVNDVPEFPPSDLICTTQEWANAFEAGRQAYNRGEFCNPPRGKVAGPWERGWTHEQKLDRRTHDGK